MILETDRLILRKWREGDLAPLSSLNADPEVMRYFLSTQSSAQSAALLGRLNDLYEKHGYTFFAAELKKTSEVIGFIGIAPVGDHMPFGPSVEIGWRLKKSVWGHGLAPEGAAEVLRFGFEDLGLGEIVSFTALVNEPSQRVMQKIGMKRDESGDFDHPKVSEGHPLERHCLYRLKRADFSPS